RPARAGHAHHRLGNVRKRTSASAAPVDHGRPDRPVRRCPAEDAGERPEVWLTYAPVNLFAFRKQLDRVLLPIVNALAKLPLHANTWTILGAVIGLIGGVVFFYGYWWPGLALLIVRGLVDHVDGYKARNFNQRSTFGAVMDDVCDRWVLGIMYAGGCLNLAN